MIGFRGDQPGSVDLVVGEVVHKHHVVDAHAHLGEGLGRRGGIEEQQLLDESRIEQLSVDDLRQASPAVFAQLDRLSRSTDKLYVHIDMDVLDPREVMGHGNKVPGGPSSDELARLFETIFRRYPSASAIGPKCSGPVAR